MKKIIALIILLYSNVNFSQNIEKQEDSNIYSEAGIDVKPEFLEGLEKLNSYLNENLVKSGFISNPKVKTKTKPKIYSTFVVEKDGSLSDIKILGKVDSRTSEELIKTLKSLPKWKPGEIKGKTIRVMHTIPIVINN